MSGHTYTHTHTHTYTHDNYYNPRCAHAHRELMRPLMQQLILLKCAASTQPIYQVGDFYSRNLIVLMQVC